MEHAAALGEHPKPRADLAISLQRLGVLPRRLDPTQDLSLTALATLHTLGHGGPYCLGELAAQQGLIQPGRSPRLPQATTRRQLSDSPRTGRRRTGMHSITWPRRLAMAAASIALAANSGLLSASTAVAAPSEYTTTATTLSIAAGVQDGSGCQYSCDGSCGYYGPYYGYYGGGYYGPYYGYYPTYGCSGY